jgi:hypothetical protein
MSFEGIGLPFLYNSAVISPKISAVALSISKTVQISKKEVSFFRCLFLLTTLFIPIYSSPRTKTEM